MRFRGKLGTHHWGLRYRKCMSPSYLAQKGIWKLTSVVAKRSTCIYSYYSERKYWSSSPSLCLLVYMLISFSICQVLANGSLVTKKVKWFATRHGGAWGERRYSSYTFLTSALDGGESSASRPGRALPPGKGPPVPIVQEARWAPEPVWTQRLEEKSSAPVEQTGA
jgi:hypothetical protein